MNHENADISNTEFLVENLTRTLLYEGYALYPYHRSAIKNQKPVPFGVVYPQHYHTCNEHAHAKTQTACIIKGSDDLIINIRVQFLHLKTIVLFEKAAPQETEARDFVPVDHVSIHGKTYQAGWQTIERKVSSGDLLLSGLIKNRQVFSVNFDKIQEIQNIEDESGQVAAKQISRVSEIKGMVRIEAAPVENRQHAFRITVRVTNTTPVENAQAVTRDEVLAQSFLSTHTLLKTANGEFISDQNPDENWKAAVAGCQHINTWPILIDKSNTTMLSSPIILYDYPSINPRSPGDLFDSTEIEEALLLHVALLSDDEQQRIGQRDEKLQAMLDRVNQVTPKEMMNFHSGLKDST